MSVADRFWYRLRPAHLLLFPLSLVFATIVALRRMLFRAGVLTSRRLRVPVVVVGNISVGGTGKTPLVVWLAHALAARGWSPGIVTRGYGGAEAIAPVHADSDPRVCGDEALLLVRRAGCPVWTGRDRAAAGSALLERHPHCDVLLSDDGLQHYRLHRDVEVVVVDGERQFGNRLLLPAGPLREPLRRLREVDAVVVNGSAGAGSATPDEARGARTPAVPPHRTFRMRLHGASLVNLRDARLRRQADEFEAQVHAVAGIGNPQRFFAHLRALGLDIRPHPFPDHHAFVEADLAFAGTQPVVMTEKDAVKCEAFARDSFWFLPVEAEVPSTFADHVDALLRKRNGRQAA